MQDASRAGRSRQTSAVPTGPAHSIPERPQSRVRLKRADAPGERSDGEVRRGGPAQLDGLDGRDVCRRVWKLPKDEQSCGGRNERKTAGSPRSRPAARATADHRPINHAMTDDRKPIPLVTRGDITRRDALRLFGAGVALAQAGCMQRPGDEIRPSVRRPEISPGVATWFATSMTVDGFATGLLAEAHAGRPIKIEGNPAHPASLGRTSARAQALILGGKINALLEGRFNVSFEDIQAVAPSALRHRLLLNFEGLAEGVSTDDIIQDLLKSVPK